MHHSEGNKHHTLRLPTAFLLFGDGMHNFIDGAAIAASFLADFRLGIITSIAVFVHEIPHELGDFGVLLEKGWGRGKVLWFNVLTGITAFAGALLTYFLGSVFEQMIPILLAITTANFIYLATIDLLPEIHHREESNRSFIPTLLFFAGIAMIAILMHFLPA
jgi:zinc and cadmium transporter